MDIEELQIMDVAKICDEYLSHYGEEEYETKFNNLKQRLIVRDFLYLSQKQIVMRKIFDDVELTASDDYDFAIWLELILTFDGLLSYTNINPNIDNVFKVPEIYDILCESGLIEYIRGYCKYDYERLTHMVETMFSWYHLVEMQKMSDRINNESVESLTKEFQKFTNANNSEYIKALGDILSYNDSLTKKVKEGIETGAYEAAMKSVKKEPSENK